jgi:hypothetical protein
VKRLQHRDIIHEKSRKQNISKKYSNSPEINPNLKEIYEMPEKLEQ